MSRVSWVHVWKQASEIMHPKFCSESRLISYFPKTDFFFLCAQKLCLTYPITEIHILSHNDEEHILSPWYSHLEPGKFFGCCPHKKTVASSPGNETVASCSHLMNSTAEPTSLPPPPNSLRLVLPSCSTEFTVICNYSEIKIRNPKWFYVSMVPEPCPSVKYSFWINNNNNKKEYNKEERYKLSSFE